MSIEKQEYVKSIQNLIKIIKTFFEINEIQAYYLYFNHYKSKLSPIDKCDIFIHENKLYYSFTLCDNQLIRELCESENKDVIRQMAILCTDHEKSKDVWWYEYNIYLNELRCIKQSEIIRDLMSRLEKLELKLENI